MKAPKQILVAILCATLPFLSGCEKFTLPTVESMDILYVVEVSQDVLQVADIELNYLDAQGKVVTEPMTRTSWKKRLPCPEFRSSIAVWPKLTPKPVLPRASYTLSVNPAAGVYADLSDGTALVDGYGFMDDEITLPRDSVALWCSISPTMALKISEYGYAQRNGYDFGGNNKENITIFRMVKWLTNIFGLNQQ